MIQLGLNIYSPCLLTFELVYTPVFNFVHTSDYWQCAYLAVN